MNISIIIPVYNRAKLIQSTLKSIIDQTYTNFECIIVDDFSTDNIQEDFFSWGLDHRFKLILNNRTKGAQGARNTGILKSSGDFICLFDSDNFMEPTFLAEHVLMLSQSVNFKVSVCHSQFYNNNLERVQQDALNFPESWVMPIGWLLIHLLKGNSYVDFNNLVFSKIVIERIGLLDESIVSFQELDFAIRISTEYEFNLVNKVLVKYIVNTADSISGSSKASIGRIQVLVKYFQFYKELSLRSDFEEQLDYAIKSLYFNKRKMKLTKYAMLNFEVQKSIFRILSKKIF